METITATKPRLGFAGVGWIGKNRMKAVSDMGLAGAMAAVDPDSEAIEEAMREVPDLEIYGSFEDMLYSNLNGIVIATPSALHAEQALAAVRRGKAVFCQKPLGRNRRETAEVVESARVHNVLLSVDFSYRYTHALREVKRAIRSGELGEIYGIQLDFHNAYGPDKPWYYETEKAGGGCLMDLGIHLVDMLYWIFDEPEITELSSRLYHKGQPLSNSDTQVEDYAAAQLVLDDRMSVQLSCSWNLPAGTDAIIEARFYGEKGGVSFRNIEGSFYDFTAEKHNGTSTQTLAAPPDDWEGRAAVDWAERLAGDNKFDTSAYTYTQVAHALDTIYRQEI